MTGLSNNVQNKPITSKTTAQVLVAENFLRGEVFISNDSTSILYILYGEGTPSSTNYSLQLPANTNGVATLIDDVFSGKISGVWASANGFAYVAEVSSS